MDVGAYLRGARERRGLTLEQVARSTKLSPGVLQLIEHNQWNRLPGGLVTRGHLRAYAAEVRVSPDDVVHEYLAQLPPPAVPPTPARRAAPAFAQPTLLVIAVATLIVAVAAYNWLANLSTAPRASAADGVRMPPAREVPVSNEVSEGPPAPISKSAPLALAIDVTGPCWVSVRADEQLALFRLLVAGESVTVGANEQLVLRVGDAGTFSYTLNGQPGRPLGDAGQPVTVKITRDNLETFTGASSSARARRGET